MKRNKIFLALVSTIVLSIAMFAGCSSGKNQPTGNQQLTKVRLNEVVRSIFYSPMYVAINEGFFKEEGLDIDLSTGQGADKTMQQVLSKNADIGFSGPEQVIYLYNQGREDYTVVFAQLTKRDGSFLVGRKPEPDFKWESLKGKTIIGGRPGGVPQMTLEYILKNHGLTPHEDVKFITNLDFTATHSAFASGTGDYVALFEPTATMIEDQNKGYIVASIGEASGEIPYTCFYATKSYMEENPDIVQKFTNALYKGVKWVESHSSEEVAASVKSFFAGSDEKQLTKVIQRYKDQDHWSKDLVLSEQALSNLMNVIQSYDADLLPSRPPYDKVVNNSFAIEAGKNYNK